VAKPDAKPDAAELVLLSVLAEGPAYGYAITKRVAATSGGEFTLTPGILYPMLARLERDGLVTVSWEAVKSERAADDPENPGRRRKWYRLSPKGRKRLSQRIEAHRSHLALLERFVGPLLRRGAPEAGARESSGGEVAG
jgi:PadR family transcriptional regulator, regulatory protein PadR